MEFNEWLEWLEESLAREAKGKEYSFERHVSSKCNQNEKEALLIKYEGQMGNLSVSPQVWVWQMYLDYYNWGREMDSVVDEIIKIAEANKEKLSVVADAVDQIRNANKNNIYFQLYNKEWNKELIEKCPSYSVTEDLVALPRLRIDNFDGDTASILITKEFARNCKMTDEEILDRAYANTVNEEYEIRGLIDAVKNIVDEDLDFVESMDTPVFVLTNKSNYCGSVAIMSKDTLKEVCNRIEENEYYIIPSSTHEVLVVPASIADPQDLQDMLLAVNPTLRPDEVLSENIYHGIGTELHVCNSLAETNMQRNEYMKKNLEKQEKSVRRAV